MPRCKPLFSRVPSGAELNAEFMFSTLLLHLITSENGSENVAIHVTCDVTSRLFVALKTLSVRALRDWKKDV